MSSVYSQVAHSVNKNKFTMMHITTLNSFLIRGNTKKKKKGTFIHKCWYSKKFSTIKMRQAESQYFKIYTWTGHLDCKVFCLLFIHIKMNTPCIKVLHLFPGSSLWIPAATDNEPCKNIHKNIMLMCLLHLQHQK